MVYTLPDGTNVNLSDIYEITDIKDYGEDEHTIDESILSFTIRLKKGKSIKVTHNYHYNDWFTIFKELRKTRNDLMDKWNKSKA